jgi:hypothetical protein
MYIEEKNQYYKKFSFLLIILIIENFSSLFFPSIHPFIRFCLYINIFDVLGKKRVNFYFISKEEAKKVLLSFNNKT